MNVTRTGLSTLFLFAWVVLGTVGAGSAAITWSPTDPTGTGVMTANTTVTLTDADYTLDTAISGAYSLTVAGNSTFKVNKFQAYTGGTIINNGATVDIIYGTSGQANGVLPNTITINAGGRLNFSVGSAMSYGNGTPTVNVNGGSITSTYEAHTIFKTLNFTNGGTIATEKTSTSWGGNFALDGNVTVNSGDAVITASRIVLSTRYADPYGGNNNNGTMTVQEGATLTVNGAIENPTGTISTDARSLTKMGLGTLTLNGKTTYSGSTNISSGTLKIGVDDAISSAKLSLNGGTLDLNGHNLSVTPNANLVGNVANGGTAKSTLTLNIASADTYNLEGVMSGDSALILQGGGTLTVSKSQTYTGGTVVENGTLTLTKNSNDWVTPDNQRYGTLRGTVTVKPNGTLAFTEGAIMGYGATAMPTLVIQGGTVDNSWSTTHNLTGPLIFSDGGVLKDTTVGRTGWAGNFGLDNRVTVTSGTENAIRAEQIMLSARYSPTYGTIPFEVQENAVLTLDGNVNKTASNGAANPCLEKTGAGKLVLTGKNNTYSGSTNILAGTLEINTLANASDTIQYATSEIVVGNDATLSIRNSESQTLTLSGITVNEGGQMNLFLTGQSSGGIHLTDDLVLNDFDSLDIALDGAATWGAEYDFTVDDGIFVGGNRILEAADFAKFLTGEAAKFMLVSANANGFTVATNNSMVPEPASFLLLLLGLMGLVKSRRR